MRKRLFGTNGIRGVTNVDLTADFAVKIGMAIGTFFNGGKIAIGNDARISGPMLKMAVASGLCATGCHVLDVGLAPTPAVEFLVRYYNCDGGVIITASHNPPEFNGIKVNDEKGVELQREKEIEIEEIFFSEKYKLPKWENVGKLVERKDWIDSYVKGMKELVDVELISKHHYRVVVDAANSVGVLVTPRLLKELGCKVYTVNSHIDGSFPGRLPEPTTKNLMELSKVVKAIGADLGVGHDGDADRSIFVDEKGDVILGDKSFALIAKNYLKKNPNETVTTPISSSTIIEDVVKAEGGKLIWTKVGSINISRMMVEKKLKLGGEENGGVFYGPHQPVRDGAMSTALILQTMAEEAKPISELIAELPEYYNFKDKIHCPEAQKEEVLKRLLEECQTPDLQVDTRDGLKIWFPDRSWILIRPSGTEPIYRLFAESREKGKPEKIVAEYRKIVEKILA
ncbi:MAG: phosphoglucosamine mutase [Candidatus Bathyarchaeota archaeon]